MDSFSQLRDELSFLHEIVGDRAQQYRNAWWLKSPFDQDIWQCQLGNTRFTLDFRVELEDGGLLTSIRHAQLLDTFKYWICAQTHFDVTGGVILSPRSAYDAVTRALRLIDYFLLNAAQFGLSKYGLEAITEGDLKRLIAELAGFQNTTESVYRWTERLTRYLKDNLWQMSWSELDTIKASQPALAIIDIERSDRRLPLSDEELIQARAYLWSKGFYQRSYNNSAYLFSPNTELLASILYRNTLWGTSPKPVPEELLILSVQRYAREHAAVPVITSVEGQLSKSRVETYRSTLRSLGLLAEIGLPVPIVAIEALSQKALLLEALKFKPAGRFRTLPQRLVFNAFKNAIEFALEYGDDLIDSYLRLTRVASEMDMSCQAYTLQFDMTGVLTHKIRAMGVRTWNLSKYMVMSNAIRSDANLGRHPAADFFSRFRANEGLLELLRVLYGCVQLCVGMLMARRQGELLDLIAGKCPDRSGKYLVFDNRKSGVDGKRQTIARPLPEVAARMINMLVRLQNGLIARGKLNEPTNLFARPDHQTGMNLIHGKESFNESLDYFCDYFETPLNSSGQRYYIRQHQLRRFFAMLFFWGRSFGGLDTLRWFLGHTDVEHLYHYVTESTPGAVLKSVKAVYATEQLREQTEGTEALADLLEKHFGTHLFSVLDSEELEEYLELLMDEGKLEIEPEFFETAEGQSYKVLIKVKGVRS